METWGGTGETQHTRWEPIKYWLPSGDTWGNCYGSSSSGVWSSPRIVQDNWATWNTDRIKNWHGLCFLHSAKPTQTKTSVEMIHHFMLSTWLWSTFIWKAKSVFEVVLWSCTILGVCSWPGSVVSGNFHHHRHQQSAAHLHPSQPGTHRPDLTLTPDNDGRNEETTESCCRFASPVWECFLFPLLPRSGGIIMSKSFVYVYTSLITQSTAGVIQNIPLSDIQFNKYTSTGPSPLHCSISWHWSCWKMMVLNSGSTNGYNFHK